MSRVRIRKLPLTAVMAATAAINLVSPTFAQAALKAAAGGKGGNAGGFSALVATLDRLGTYFIVVGGSLGFLAIVGAGITLLTGNPQAVQRLGYVAFALIIIVGAKGITM